MLFERWREEVVNLPGEMRTYDVITDFGAQQTS